MTEPIPQLDLSFRRHPVRGTWLDRRRFRWPYTLARGFRFDGVPAHTLMLIVQTVSGAIQADDCLVQHIRVGADAAAHVRTQGATPVYRAPAGLSATDDIVLDVEDGGCIEYRPELRILFPDSSLEQRMLVRLPESAFALVADGFVVHDPNGTKGPFRRYDSTTLLQRPDGKLLAVDRIELAAPPSNSGRRGRYVAHGTLFLAACRPAEWLDRLSTGVASALGGIAGIYAAASPLPNDAGVSVRVAAIDGRHLRLGLQAARAILRGHLAVDAAA